jgi:dephospho-CoA kinase
MKILGVTGGSGSGKSTICNILREEYNTYIIDADKIGHAIIKYKSFAYAEIISAFGQQILDESLEIDRKKLGNIIFNSNEKLNMLNKITFKHITIEIRDRINQADSAGYKLCAIDAALLLDTDLKNTCDDIWIVDSDINIRTDRIIERDKITKEAALERINNQKYDYGSYKVINNNMDINALKIQIQKCIKSLLI